MSEEANSVRVSQFATLEFSPCFEYREMAQLAETCGAKEVTELGTDCIRPITCRWRSSSADATRQNLVAKWYAIDLPIGFGFIGLFDSSIKAIDRHA